MKKYLKVICALTVLIISLSGCSGTSEKKESSAEEVSTVSRTLTAYEKNTLGDSVEFPLEMACTTLYECVCKGSVTKDSAVGKFSFANAIPDGNTSPNEKIKAADMLTIRNATEYFSLTDIYTDENIRQYGYMTANYKDVQLIKGTVINISAFEKISDDFARFDSLDMKLGDFIDSRLLLSR